MTIDELLPKLREMQRLSPRGGATALFVLTGEGYSSVEDFGPDIDHDAPGEPAPIGVFELAPVAAE